MSRAAVGRATSLAQLLAAGTLAVCGVRFAGIGVMYAVKSRTPVLESAKPAPPPPPPPASTSAAPATTPQGPSTKAGTALRVSLVVNAGPSRAEVIVDGMTVGHSPYLGEVSCKAGEKIKIDVLPRSGTPQTYERICAPGTLHIGD